MSQEFPILPEGGDENPCPRLEWMVELALFFTMTDTVAIRGHDYKIESFSDLHLSTINNLLNDLGNLQYQSDAGFVLKEIILPDLPIELIRQSANGKYILLLNATEINDVIIAIMKVYYNRELAKAQEAGDKNYEAQIKANMTELQINTVMTPTSDNRQQELDELAQLRAENAMLKAKS